ncbi:MAG: hypothetical protein VKL42_01670 [Snowella sp.]|nr:hypothetical protein [Snowella sp.]
MEELLNRLQDILREETELGRLKKENEDKKYLVLKELEPLIVADVYSNDFVSLKKKNGRLISYKKKYGLI